MKTKTSRKSSSDSYSIYSLEATDSNAENQHDILPYFNDVPLQNISQEPTRRSAISSILEAIDDENQQTRNGATSLYSNDRVIPIDDSTIMEAVDLAVHKVKTGAHECDDDSAEKISLISETPEKNVNDQPPDGGITAWLTVTGACLFVMSTWGANAAYGVFLNYYLTNHIFSGATPYDFALIGGMVIFLAQVLAPVAMILQRTFGYYPAVIFGIVVQFTGWFTASYAKTIWHLYLSQGVCVGLSASFLFVPVSTLIPEYFVKNRAYAMSIAVAGSGFGGVLFSLSVNAVIDRAGDQRWALRMVCFVVTFISVIGLIISRPRVHRSRITNCLDFKAQCKIIFNFRIALKQQVCLVASWFAIVNLGYVVLLFSISPFATMICGLSAKQGSILTAVMNTGQIVGRPCMGLMADRFGRLNFTITINLFVAILIWCWWIPVRSFAALLPFSFILGAVIGIGSVMNAVLTADSVSTTQFPAAWSFVNIVGGCLSLVAEVMALGIRDFSMSNPFLNTQIFSGFAFFIGVILLLALRQWKIYRLLVQRQSHNESQLQEIHSKSNLECTELTEDYVPYEIMIKRKQKYDVLLKDGIKAYILRTLYPIKT
ncbi:hypothetical protein LJB42_003015 [Komagataella kurtzmanii]|nr:hypothetical protein LJB42_003015 [Komagataella kurtzmanii]